MDNANECRNGCTLGGQPIPVMRDGYCRECIADMDELTPGTVYGNGTEVIGVAADGMHVTLGNVQRTVVRDGAKFRDVGWVAFTPGTLRYLAACPTPDMW